MIALNVADHVNSLAANNPLEIQQYLFENIARELRVTTEQVRAALPDGGYNGITFGVTENDRRALTAYLRS